MPGFINRKATVPSAPMDEMILAAIVVVASAVVFVANYRFVRWWLRRRPRR